MSFALMKTVKRKCFATGGNISLSKWSPFSILYLRNPDDGGYFFFLCFFLLLLSISLLFIYPFFAELILRQLSTRLHAFILALLSFVIFFLPVIAAVLMQTFIGITVRMQEQLNYNKSAQQRPRDFSEIITCRFSCYCYL